MIDEITLLRAREAGLPAAESHPDPFLVCYPMRIEWEATLPAVPESHAWPAPEVTSTPTTDYRGKSAVASMVSAVQARGWSVVVTEACGAYPGVGGRPSRQRWSLAVRMACGPRRAVAVYSEGPSEGSSWAWDSLWWWTAGFPRLHMEEGVTGFMDALLGPVQDRPTLKDAGLGPMHGPKVMPRGFLAKIGPVHGPELPPGWNRLF